jgi:outer membrane receptor protein involved in Fe transport
MNSRCRFFSLASLIAFLFAVLTLLPAPRALAQTSLGTITGTVRDSSGAVIANAGVTATNEATQVARTVVTNSEGAFRFDAVQPGPYSIKVNATGFDPKEIDHLPVPPSVITSQDVTLAIGKLTSVVQVEAANTATLDTDTGQIADTISTTQLADQPIMTLNPVELAETVPGVQLVNNGGLSNGIDIIANGTRPRDNNFLIDGQDDNDNSIGGQALQANIPDMYTSVSILTNSFSAEFGRAGGAVVNMVTKSGTNTPHGTAWDLYEGSGLNAIDGQSRGVPGETKARYDQHQFGFTVGGPLLRDRLWAFGGSQWSRFYGKATPNVIDLPNPASYALLQSFNNANANLMLKYIGSLSQYIPVNGSSLSQTILNEPGCATCTVVFSPYKRPNQGQTNTDTQYTFKIDYQATEKDHLSGRFLHDYNVISPDWFNFASQLPGFDSDQGGPAEQGGGEYTHIFSSTLINEFRISATRINFAFAPLPATIANPLYTSPVINISNSGLPQLGPQSTSLPQGRGHDFYQFQDTVSKTFGRNTVRIGADLSRVLVRDFVPFNNFGSLSFTKSTGYSALNNFLDNYLGTGGIAERGFGSNRLDSHQWQMAYFAQDDIKLTPDLTVNLGLRWEFQTDPENAMPYPALNPATVLSDPITAHYKVAEDLNNFGPRVGAAWNPHHGMGFLGDGKTVYHAAGGIFYDVLFTNIPDNSLASAPNTQLPLVEITTGRGAPNAMSIIPGLVPSSTISPLGSVELTTNNLVNPQTYEWNLGIERQLPSQTKLTVNYVGDRSEKQYANQQYNYFNPATGRRLDPARGAIVARGNFADGVYHGLQIGVTHDLHHGLFLSGSYDFSKALDDGSEVFSFTGQDTSYSANLAPGGRKQDWGPSVYDHRQYAALTYVWQVPAIPQLNSAGLNEAVDIVARKWQFSGESFWQTGEWNSFNLYGLDANGDGSSTNDRPLVGNRHAGYETIGIDGAAIGCTPGVFFDYGANDVSGACNQVNIADVHWVVPYPYTAANVAAEIGRNSFQNPGYWNENWALQKGFGLHIRRMENAALQLRGEAQNVFNHNNVGILDTHLLDAAPGPGDPFMNKNAARFDDERQLRVWMKFVF